MKQYPYSIKIPFIVPSSEIPAILDELKKIGLHESVSLAIRYDTDEPYKGKWEIRFSVADAIAFNWLNRQLAPLMSTVWYGADYTSRATAEGVFAPPPSVAEKEALCEARNVLLRMRHR